MFLLILMRMVMEVSLGRLILLNQLKLRYVYLRVIYHLLVSII